MAETLGVVAGVFGAASLAIQLIEKTNKIKTLVDSIKDAPKEIQHMLTEIEILTDVVHEIKELYDQGPAIPASKPGARGLKLCQETVSEMESILREVDDCCKPTNRRLSWKGLKANHQKDKAKAVTARVQRALQLLMMINQIYFQ